MNAESEGEREDWSSHFLHAVCVESKRAPKRKSFPEISIMRISVVPAGRHQKKKPQSYKSTVKAAYYDPHLAATSKGCSNCYGSKSDEVV